MEPFFLPYSRPAVEDLRERLRRTRWPDEIAGAAWEYGFDLAFLQEICHYWDSEFDWESQVRQLSELPHFRYLADGVGIHFIHAHGKGPDPIPLILTHGWPGSFLEMLRILPLLTDRPRTGVTPPTRSTSWFPPCPATGSRIGRKNGG